jgi:integrase
MRPITGTFIQALKDTGARTAEASKIQWIDIDEESSTIRINHSVRGSLAGILKVAPKTIAMMNNLPKNRRLRIHTNVQTIRNLFDKQRGRITRNPQNPRLRQTHLHTLRHWKATMEFHRTLNIKIVQQMLGHKKLETTDMYTQLIDYECEE